MGLFLELIHLIPLFNCRLSIKGSDTQSVSGNYKVIQCHVSSATVEMKLIWESFATRWVAKNEGPPAKRRRKQMIQFAFRV